MTARHHHYLSQCYLKGFTKGGSKKSKLSVTDLREKKYFKTIPRNVGGIRDFNRVNIDGVDQNAIEKNIAEFEGTAALALQRIQKTIQFTGEEKNYILNLMAMLAIRSPERREQWRQFQEKIAMRILDLSLESKERWEFQNEKRKNTKYESKKEISYEQAKAFHESKAYTINVSKEHHLRMEMVGIDTILPLLAGRNWLLIQTKSNAPFITTDNPIVLTWKEPDKVPPLYRKSPGFGLKETEVYFPLSKSLALIGEFGGKHGAIQATEELVAVLNSKMLMFAYKQIYAPKFNYNFYGHNGKLDSGRNLLHEIKLYLTESRK